MTTKLTKSDIAANAQARSDEVEVDLSNAPKVPDQFADESFKLFSKIQVTDPTTEEANQIRKKCLWRILPFLCIGYHLMYVDKQTVCETSTFYDQNDTNLTNI
jgi:hypothetical protein